MNGKLVLILMLIVISVIIFSTEASRWERLEENKTVDIKNIEKQLEYLRITQVEANRVIMADDTVQELINGQEYLKVLEIIHNESYVDDFYRIGFQYERLEECKGYKMVGGKNYKFSIDLSNKTVLSIEEAENRNPSVKEIKEEGFIDGAYTYIHSLESIRGFTGVYHRGSQKWAYDFRVDGIGDVRLTPNPSPKAHGWGCFKHHVTLEEIYNKENFYFNEHEFDPENKKAWCNGDKLPHIESRSEGEVLTCEVTYPREKSVFEFTKPRNYPSDAGFSYSWYMWVEPNQTIVFDMAMKFQSIENARNTYENAHEWRVFLSSPPSPYELPDDDMTQWGIGVVAHSTKSCNYYAYTPIIIVKKDGGET